MDYIEHMEYIEKCYRLLTQTHDKIVSRFNDIIEENKNLIEELEASKGLAKIYFEIAEKEIGCNEVRKRRDLAIENIKKTKREKNNV